MSKVGDVYDKRGRKIGEVRRADDGGCSLFLIGVGVVVAIIVGIIIGVTSLWGSMQNYFTYHVWTSNRNDAIKYATVTAIASSPNPFGGTLVLDDPLHDNSMGYKWEEDNDNKGDACQFKNGAYHVTVIEGANICTAAVPTFTNLAFQINMVIGSSLGGGILFRVHEQLNSNNAITSLNGYEFSIDGASGIYNLYVYKNNNQKTLISGNVPSDFNYSQSQSLAVVANGSKFDLYVNNEHVASVSDNSFSNGQIAVIGYRAPDEGDEIVFSDAKVWKL